MHLSATQENAMNVESPAELNVNLHPHFPHAQSFGFDVLAGTTNATLQNTNNNNNNSSNNVMAPQQGVSNAANDNTLGILGPQVTNNNNSNNITNNTTASTLPGLLPGQLPVFPAPHLLHAHFGDPTASGALVSGHHVPLTALDLTVGPFGAMRRRDATELQLVRSCCYCIVFEE
jgi:hypothetical protein